jgi:ankyrin repeat protein
VSGHHTHPISASPISKALHGFFAIFWLAFTSFHAYFMLGGALRSGGHGVLFFLIPFYALFFGVGFWMLRSWLRWRALKRRYGNATLLQAPDLALGEQAAFHLRFDRAWPADTLAAHPLSGTLTWQRYDSDGDPTGAAHSIPIAVQATPMGDHTTVRASAVKPQTLPAEALASKHAELLLETAPGQGWRFVVPFAPKVSAFDHAQQPGATVLNASQVAKGQRILGSIALAAMVGAVAIAVYALMASHFSFFRLAFAVPLSYAGLIMWKLRSRIAAQNQATLEADHPAQALAFKSSITRWAPLIGVVMFGAFAADIFVPRHVSERIASTITRSAAPALGIKRPAKPATFALPAYPFNSLMAMQVTAQGTGTLNQNTLTLQFDSLELTELLNQASSNRLTHGKLGLEIIKDSGDHVTAVSNEVTLPYTNTERARIVRLANVQAVFNLEPTADLSQIWLRLKVHSARGYAPIDAPAGHLAQAIALTDPTFSTCGGVMSIRAAITRHCNDELAQRLAAPHWQLWERVARWRSQPPLMHHALAEGNAQAVSILHRAGVGLEELDEKDRTPLMMAAWNNRLDVVDALLAAGANPLYQPQSNKHSALTGSLYDHHLQSARRLFKSPRDLEDHLQQWNYRAEHRVAMDGQIQTLQMLLDAGVPVDSANAGSNGRGETLLMAAARSKTNSVAMLRMLLARGARLNAQDAHGKNATDWAEFFGNPDASDFLCAQGLEPTALDGGGQNKEQRKRANCQAPSAART